MGVLRNLPILNGESWWDRTTNPLLKSSPPDPSGPTQQDSRC
jgi:hypothetical protein